MLRTKTLLFLCICHELYYSPQTCARRAHVLRFLQSKARPREEATRDGILILDDIAISNPFEELHHPPLLLRRHLHAREHAADVCPMVTVLEQGDIPTDGVERVEEVHQSTGAFRKLEADEPLV